MNDTQIIYDWVKMWLGYESYSISKLKLKEDKAYYQGKIDAYEQLLKDLERNIPFIWKKNLT